MLSTIGAGHRASAEATLSSPVQAAATSPPLAPAVAAPGDWRLTRRLPGGRFALFRAATRGDLGPGCYVLKTCRAEYRADEVAESMLRREARVAAEIADPNLISVLSADGNDQWPRVVMPYLEGVTLRRLTGKASPSLPVVQALSICRQVAGGLTALHGAGWLHGQVRPEHVVVSPQGHATLIDLTQVRRFGDSECDCAGSLLAGHGNVSAAYAAPELFSSSGRLTPAADVYSLGVILFEALAGHLPFPFTNRRQLVEAHRNAAPPDLRQLHYTVSLEVAELVRRMLAKEPLRRPDAGQVVRWLAELEIEELRH